MNRYDSIALSIMQKKDLEDISTEFNIGIRQLQRIKKQYIESLVGNTNLTREERKEFEDSTRFNLSELTKKIEAEPSTDLIISNTPSNPSDIVDKMIQEILYNDFKNLARLSRDPNPSVKDLKHRDVLLKTLNHFKDLKYETSN